MFKRRFLLRLSAGFLIPLSSVAMLALPSKQSQPMMRGPHGECWCGCDKMAGHARCSWATSCHKTTITPEGTPSPAPAPAKPAFHTSRRYRYLYAQNQASTKTDTPHPGAL